MFSQSLTAARLDSYPNTKKLKISNKDLAISFADDRTFNFLLKLTDK